MKFFHKSVFLEKAVELLNIKPSGVYVDATAGGGGHSESIVKKLSGAGKLISLDQDPDAIKFLKAKFKSCKNLFVFEKNFVNIDEVLDELKVDLVDGFLFDLGVSSYQLDNVSRGFSYKKDAALDMRMSKSGFSARDFVNTACEKKISQVIKEFGEEKYADSIARNLVKSRSEKSVETTFDLVEIIKQSLPQKVLKSKGHPAKKTFQAIRIYVNSELSILEKTLGLAFKRLAPHGRIVAITFHSLEDRIVKKKFTSFSSGCCCPPYFPICTCGKKPEAILLTKKPLKPTEREIEENPRCKSAKLRACEKIFSK